MDVGAICVAIILAVVIGGPVFVGWALSAPPPRSIPEICDDVIREFKRDKLPGLARQIYQEVVAEPQFAWFRFIKQIQAELQRVDPTIPDAEAFKLARGVYHMHLQDEKIEFGHPDFAWDRDGAVDLAHAYEIEYWESRA